MKWQQQIKASGKCSWFGGPEDMGVSPSEGLAFIYEIDDAPDLFLAQQPPNTTGLARRLNPDKFYIACRWKYDLPGMSKEDLLTTKVLVRSPRTGREFIATPADWGPHVDTGRIADLSPGLLEALGIQTDDEVEVTFPAPSLVEPAEVPAIVISSGHGLKIRGASGVIDEVDEARQVVPLVAEYLRSKGCRVYEFHDNTSTTQDQNLKTIVDFHNSHQPDLNVSVHFNAYEDTDGPMGTECLYLTQPDLAARVSEAVGLAGTLIDRGAKQRTNLYFLNKTNEPAILIEVCFCDSSWDADLYKSKLDAICEAIADAIIGD